MNLFVRCYLLLAAWKTWIFINMMPEVIKTGTYKNYFDIYYIQHKKSLKYIKVAMLKDTFDFRVIQCIQDNKDNILLCETDDCLCDITNDFLSVFFYFCKSKAFKNAVLDYLSHENKNIYYYTMDNLEKKKIV